VAARPLTLTPKAAKFLADGGRDRLASLLPALQATGEWVEAALESTVRGVAEEQALKLGQIAQPLRAALTGSESSPGLFEVMAILGRDECLARIADQVTVMTSP
jgi:glutamyl-tRNA synthetase